MIKSFADKRTQELYARGKAKRFPQDVAKRAARKLEYVDWATRLNDLKVPSGNRLHALKEIEKVGTQFPSTTNGVSAFALLTVMLTMLRFVIIIKMRCE